MAAKGVKKEGEEGKKEDGDMTLQLSLVRHGRDKQKTGVPGKNTRRATFNIGWTYSQNRLDLTTLRQ